VKPPDDRGDKEKKSQNEFSNVSSGIVFGEVEFLFEKIVFL
jgi:hypothetical protein